MRIHPAVTYGLGRLAIFTAVAGGLFLVGLRGWILILVALVVSIPLAWWLLKRQRELLAQNMMERADRRAAEKERLRTALRGE